MASVAPQGNQTGSSTQASTGTEPIPELVRCISCQESIVEKYGVMMYCDFHFNLAQSRWHETKEMSEVAGKTRAKVESDLFNAICRGDAAEEENLWRMQAAAQKAHEAAKALEIAAHIGFHGRTYGTAQCSPCLAGST